MKSIYFFAIFPMFVLPTNGATIFLDADSPATGSNLVASPLVTPFGTITFSGELASFSTDPEFIAAGSSGWAFDIITNNPAQLTFNFDVSSISYIYGGNVGVFKAEARNASGTVVSSFFQADTYAGQPAGPITMTGTGIRQLVWSDNPGRTYAAIDNVRIEVVPEPSSIMLVGAFSALLGFCHRKSVSRNRA